jgi:hypothetical protein
MILHNAMLAPFAPVEETKSLNKGVALGCALGQSHNANCCYCSLLGKEEQCQ